MGWKNNLRASWRLSSPSGQRSEPCRTRLTYHFGSICSGKDSLSLFPPISASLMSCHTCLLDVIGSEQGRAARVVGGGKVCELWARMVCREGRADRFSHVGIYMSRGSLTPQICHSFIPSAGMIPIERALRWCQTRRHRC